MLLLIIGSFYIILYVKLIRPENVQLSISRLLSNGQLLLYCAQ